MNDVVMTDEMCETDKNLTNLAMNELYRKEVGPYTNLASCSI